MMPPLAKVFGGIAAVLVTFMVIGLLLFLRRRNIGTREYRRER